MWKPDPFGEIPSTLSRIIPVIWFFSPKEDFWGPRWIFIRKRIFLHKSLSFVFGRNAFIPRRQEKPSRCAEPPGKALNSWNQNPRKKLPHTHMCWLLNASVGESTVVWKCIIWWVRANHTPWLPQTPGSWNPFDGNWPGPAERSPPVKEPKVHFLFLGRGRWMFMVLLVLYPRGPETSPYWPQKTWPFITPKNHIQPDYFCFEFLLGN